MSGLFAQQEPTIFNVTLAFVVADSRGLIPAEPINGTIIARRRRPAPYHACTLTAYRGFVVWYRVNPIYNLQDYYRVLGQRTLWACQSP